MKIIDYRIIHGSKNRPLPEHVRYQIDKDYQPYGYPYLDKNGIEKQVMVKYEEDPEAGYVHVTCSKVVGEPIAYTPEKTKTKPKKKVKKNED